MNNNTTIEALREMVINEIHETNDSDLLDLVLKLLILSKKEGA